MVSFIRFLEAMYSVGLASRRAILLPSGIASLLSKPSQTQKMKLVWLVGTCKSQFQLLDISCLAFEPDSSQAENATNKSIYRLQTA